MEIQLACLGCKLGHCLYRAAGVAAYEVGDNLLAKIFAAVDVIKNALEVVEELERWLAHEVEHTIACMFGCHLQSSAHVAGDEFASIFACGSVDSFVLALMKQQIVAHTATYEALLDAWQCVHTTVDVHEWAVISV